MKSLHRTVLVFAASSVLSLFSPLVSGAISRDSTPLKIIQTGEANFPPDLATAGINTGRARAVVNIDADGKLADFIITAYSHPQFAREVADSLRAWTYEPAREHGKPVGSRVELGFLFEARGLVISLNRFDNLDAHTNRMFGNEAKIISTTANPRELDRPLAAVESVRPQHPGKLITPAATEGTATLDFYVDAEGKPRMPVVINTSNEVFALAAVDALSKWRFAPPTSAGRPVAVRVRQQFVFRVGS